MGRGAQAPIRHQHIPCLQARMDLLHLGQVVRHERRGHDFQEQAGASMGQPQQPRDGNATPRSVPRRLPERLLQSWGIRHRTARAVDDIGTDGHDDRDRAGGILGRPNRWGSPSHDDVHGEPDQSRLWGPSRPMVRLARLAVVENQQSEREMPTPRPPAITFRRPFLSMSDQPAPWHAHCGSLRQRYPCWRDSRWLGGMTIVGCLTLVLMSVLVEARAWYPPQRWVG